MSNNNQIFFIYLIFIYAFSVVSCISIGKKDSVMNINVFLNIGDKKSKSTLSPLIEALDKICYKPIESHLLHIKIVTVVDGLNTNSKFILFYLNNLEIISQEFNDCFSCNLNKFLRGVSFIQKILENYSKLAKLSYSDFVSQIMLLFPFIQEQDFALVLHDKEAKHVYRKNMLEYNLFTTGAPFITINGASINSPEKLNSEYWLRAFTNNFPVEECKTKISSFNSE